MLKSLKELSQKSVSRQIMEAAHSSTSDDTTESVTNNVKSIGELVPIQRVLGSEMDGVLE